MTSSNDAIVTEEADVVSSDEIAEVYKRWDAPHVVSVVDVEGGHGPLTVEDLEAVQKEAHDEGFKAGFEEGRQAGLDAGQEDIQEQIAYLQDIITTLNTPLEDLDEQVEQDLLNLVITMTRQLVLHELNIKPEYVVDAMRAAMAVLPITDRKLKIFLHPQDIELVKKDLSVEDSDVRWQWVEEPLLTRGGVRLETTDTTVDATVEARMNSLINKLLGEDHSDDNTE